VVIVKNETNKLEASKSKGATYHDRLQIKEADLHELLVEQTQELQMARFYSMECQRAVETTMRQLEDIRYKLYRLWQEAP